MSVPSVAVVLPPREPFSPAATGAVGLLVRRLALAGSDFTTFVLGMPTSAPFIDVAFRPVSPRWTPRPHALRYAAGVARALAAAAPALIEVHNRPDVADFLASRLPRVPVVLVLHNDPHGMRRARTPTDRAALLRRLAGVVAVSDYLRVRFLDGVAGSVAVLPNCVDLTEIPPPGPRSPTILFAGRVVADKGADVFVRACAMALPHLPGWRAELLGADRFGADSPDTAFIAALRPRAAAAGIALTGWRPHAEVLTAMARAAIVVAPSRWPEPFGLTALEAMACGAALITARRGGLPDVVGDAALVLDDPEDVAALADAILALARAPERRLVLSAAGRARARRFDVVPTSAALCALRRQALAAWPDRQRHPI